MFVSKVQIHQLPWSKRGHDKVIISFSVSDHRKMSLPTTGAFLQGELAARQINARGRRYSGPDLSVTKPNMAVAIRSACSFDDFEKDEKFGQSVFSNIGDAMTDGDHDPVKSTKLISRTIRLNLNTSTKSGRPCEFQDSPKSMKRCSRPDVRKVFKDIQQFTQLSPSCSPQGSLRGSPRGSLKGSNSHDLHRWNSPVSSPKRGSYASASAMNIAPGTWMDNFWGISLNTEYGSHNITSFKVHYCWALSDTFSLVGFLIALHH